MLFRSPHSTERRFLGSPVSLTSPAAIRRFPPPPAAAPATGGWGNTGSRRVHSVELSRSSAGGAEETAARSVWLCRAAGVLFDGEVPVDFAVVRLSCPCLRFLGAAGRDFPSPETAVRRLWLCNKKTALMWSRSTTLAAQDGGSTELSSGVSPSAVGIRPIQGFRGEFAAAMHWRVLLVAGDDVEVQRDCFVISFFVLDWFVIPLYF